MTSILLFFIPGLLIFGTLAFIYRLKTPDKRPHIIIALILGVVVWLGTWMFGLWLYLDVLSSGKAGDVAGPGMIWSFIVWYFFHTILRRKPDQNNEVGF